MPKLKAMIRYFASHTDPELLGKKKLMKLFYFSDFGHVKKYGAPITYDNYVHLEHGPIPSTIMNLISSVENEKDDSILGDALKVETRNGSNMKRIVIYKKFDDQDKKYLNNTELKVLEEVCKKFFSSTGKSIEDASHKEAGWLMTNELANIPYTLAVNDLDCLVEKEDIETLLEISK
jgi:uncharacterized phage-associated protein